MTSRGDEVRTATWVWLALLVAAIIVPVGLLSSYAEGFLYEESPSKTLFEGAELTFALVPFLSLVAFLAVPRCTLTSDDGVRITRGFRSTVVSWQGLTADQRLGIGGVVFHGNTVPCGPKSTDFVLDRQQARAVFNHPKGAGLERSAAVQAFLGGEPIVRLLRR